MPTLGSSALPSPSVTRIAPVDAFRWTLQLLHAAVTTGTSLREAIEARLGFAWPAGCAV